MCSVRAGSISEEEFGLDILLSTVVLNEDMQNSHGRFYYLQTRACF